MKTPFTKLNNKGFTLAEVLVTLLILMMLTALVAGGMPVATNAYYKIVDCANAQLLLSTTMTELRNELGTGENISVDDAFTRVAYKSINTGDAEIYKADDGIYINEYANYSGDQYEPRLLVSAKAATKDLVISYDKVEFSDGVVTFTNLHVDKGAKTLASVPAYNIKVL